MKAGFEQISCSESYPHRNMLFSIPGGVVIMMQQPRPGNCPRVLASCLEAAVHGVRRGHDISR